MKNLKELRKSSNMTLQELAEELGTSNQVLSRYERCEREADYTMLKKIATFFNVSIDYLLDFKSATNTSKIITPDERRLIEMYQQLPKPLQENINAEIKGMVIAVQNNKNKIKEYNQ